MPVVICDSSDRESLRKRFVIEKITYFNLDST